VRVFQQV